MKVVYKLMSSDDVDEVFNISNSSFSIPWSKTSIESEISNPLAKYIVAKDIETNKTLGFVGIWIIAGEGDITNIAINPLYRGLKIGRGLLTNLINLCKDLNCTLINLEVRSSNLIAINLYKSFGFIEVGLRKGYYQDNNEDAILMNLEISL